MVAVVRSEAEPAVQGQGGLVAVLDLEEDAAGAALGGVGDQRGGDRGAQAAAAIVRVDLDRGQAGPVVPVAWAPLLWSPLLPVPATRPMATVRSPSRADANACQGAEVRIVRATGGSSGWPRKW